MENAPDPTDRKENGTFDDAPAPAGVDLSQNPDGSGRTQEKIRRFIETAMLPTSWETDYKKLVQVLNKIGTALNRYENLDDLLAMIVDEIIGIIRCDACSVYIREKDPDSLIFKTTRSLHLEGKSVEGAQGFKSFPVPLNTKSISGYVAVTGEVVNIEDCYFIGDDCEYSFNRAYDDKMNYRTKSMLAVPMKLKSGEVIGVLQLINKLGFRADGSGLVVPFTAEHEGVVGSIASQMAISIETNRLIEAQKFLLLSTVNSLTDAIESKSAHTAMHTKRVSAITEGIVHALHESTEGSYAHLRFTKAEREEIKLAALLHDIGKITTPERILDKSNKLSEEQMALIRERFEILKHVEELKWRPFDWLDDDFAFIVRINEAGVVKPEEAAAIAEIGAKRYELSNGHTKPLLTEAEVKFLSVRRGTFTEEERAIMNNHIVATKSILGHIKFTDDLKNIPLYAGDHHEKMDGSGYPDGKMGHDIPFASRILALADIYEALTAKRVYKPGMPWEKAVAIIRREAEDGKLDLELVEFFISNELFKDSEI